MTQSSTNASQLSVTKRALLELKELQAKIKTLEQEKSEPIAIVGMHCRFPGDANDTEALWQILRTGTDTVTEIPAERWDIDAYYDQNPDTPNKMSTRWGAFLKTIDTFDASFFGISPREAEFMDPQQRLLLEVSWNALEHAGMAADTLAGSQTGVFFGSHNNEYSWFQFDSADHINTYSGTGVSHSIMAGRISYLFDFHGPSIALDTACSSSLVAVHLACQSLRNRECNLALAGGVSVMLSPLSFIATSKLHMMSPDGRCKTFDARADGYVKGEGCGVVVLKRLSDALTDGDRILALIRGTAVNQDGQRNGLTAPNAHAQQLVLRQALHNANVKPEQIGYIETHGTGTALGDPIEFEALSSIYGTPRPDKTPCFLGAIKTNMGHLEAAAGIAGLIKTVLILQHEEIPPNLHFHSLNPNISLENTPFVIPTNLAAWPTSDQKHYAAVSSFGWAGTNAHAILEAPPSVPTPVFFTPLSEQPDYLLPLSARDPQALREHASHYHAFLAESPQSVHDICFSASLRQAHNPLKFAVRGRTKAELQDALDAWIAEQTQVLVQKERNEKGAQPNVVFVFPGQGSQWTGMARELLRQEPVFTAKMVLCEMSMRPYVKWSLLDILLDKAGTSPIDRIDVIQPTLFAIEVSLAALWQSWGITPDFVIGHSMGEVAAAHVAGALSLEDAARIICLRSQLLLQIQGKGAMLAAELPLQQAQELLELFPEGVSIGVNNSSRSTVLSGLSDVLQDIQHYLDERQIFCRWVKVDVASHSPQVDILREPLHELLHTIRPQKTQIAMYSTVTGSLVTGTELTANYWIQNLRSPVLFASTIQTLLQNAPTIFLELSPHPILTPSIEEGIRDAEGADRSSLAVGSLRRNEPERAMLLNTVATLYSASYPIDWHAFYPSGGQNIPLPLYAWQRERFWLHYHSNLLVATKPFMPQTEIHLHPLLGKHIDASLAQQTHIWEQEISLQDLPYLLDHGIQNMLVFPAAAYLEMGLAAAYLLKKNYQWQIQDLSFKEMLILTTEKAQICQLVLSKEQQGYQLQIRSSEDKQAEEKNWTVHATGSLLERTTSDDHSLPVSFSIKDFQQNSAHMLSHEDVYRALESRELRYGPTFRGIQQVWLQEQEAVVHIAIPGGTKSQASRYQLHPALLDACFQSLGTVLQNQQLQGVFFPIGIETVRYHKSLEHDASSLWVYAHLFQTEARAEERLQLRGDIWLFDEHEQLVLEVHGLCFQALEIHNVAEHDPAQEWFYELAWKPLEPVKREQVEQLPTHWLILADNQNIALTVRTALMKQGHICSTLVPGDSFLRLAENQYQLDYTQPEHFTLFLKELQQHTSSPIQHILHFWSLQQQEKTALNYLSEVQQLQDLACSSTLYLVRALLYMGWRDLPRLWLITQESQFINNNSSLNGTAQAALWGLAKTINHEQPALHTTLIDLPHEVGDKEYQTLLDFFSNGTGQEHEIVLHEQRCYGARLVQRPFRMTPPLSFKAPLIHQNGTYLITGGLGGIGRVLAAWLVEQQAGAIVLVSRHMPTEEMQPWLKELRQKGTIITVLQCDISQSTQVAQLLAHIKATLFPLRGIFHAAGVLKDATLLNLKQEHFREVMAPKVAGTWNIHEQTLTENLDLFVLFSSAVSLLGSPGQGNYSAANAYLDALAGWRRSRAMPVLSINWGPWANVGLAAAQVNRGERMTLRGIVSIQPKQALDILEQLLRAGNAISHLAIMSLNIRHWYQSYPGIAQSPLFSDLIEQSLNGERIERGKSRFRAQLQQIASPSERRVMIEQYLREQLAQVLHMTPTKIYAQTSMKSLGLDSLMALELRNRLETHLELTLPATIAWTYPTVATLTEYLNMKIEGNTNQELIVEPDNVAMPPIKADGVSLAGDIADDIVELSDQEIEIRLRRQLELGGY